MRRVCFAVLALLLLCPGPFVPAALAAEEPVDDPPAEEAGETSERPAIEPVQEGAHGAAAGPRVLCAYRFVRRVEKAAGEGVTPAPAVDAHGCPNAADRRMVRLGHHLVVRVDGLGGWLEAEEKGQADLRLFLDGVEITDLEAEAVQAVADREGVSDVRFRLRRDAENRDAWRGLLGPFKLRPREVTVGVGLEGEDEVAGSSSTRLHLDAVQGGWFKFYVVLLLGFVVGFFTFRRRGRRLTDSLRDSQAEGTPRPFSLARCQMAWWFFLVIAAYVFLWLVLGDLDSITGSILTLMGIGSGTALGAAMIDGGKKAEQAQAQAEADEIENKATASVAEKATANAKLASVAGSVKKGSAGFLADLLSDGSGYSFHRFQIVVWTIILGIIFVASVLHELAMPQFSETLLGLMGISSGTYLGFKFPERFQ